MSYVYIESEPGVFTVGHYAPLARQHETMGGHPVTITRRETTWIPESDYSDREAAAARVHYLNGGAWDGVARRKEP